MKALKYVFAAVLVLMLILPAAAADIPEFGSLYGDLYVILRDEDGVPILSADGCIQPISDVIEVESVTIETLTGEITITAYPGEPFSLASYTDTAGDEVDCELLEEMANWVQEVDFGRLNLGRAPYSVIAHAFDEAINKMNAANEIGLDPSGRLILTAAADGTVKTIDSPAENLALYIKMMVDGHWITLDTDPVEPGGSPIELGGRPEGKGGRPTDDPEDPDDGDGPSTEPRPVLSPEAAFLLYELGYDLDDTTRASGEDLTDAELLLAASLLAAAADKTGNITLDKLVYINSIYGINQVGSLTTEVDGERYFDFGALALYGKDATFGDRQSGDCEPGWIWVLQPELDENNVEVTNHFETTCMNILGYELDPTNDDYQSNAVHFTHMEEIYATEGLVNYLEFDSKVRGFVQASDDALQVLEYVHNYKVPEVLYPVEPELE